MTAPLAVPFEDACVRMAVKNISRVKKHGQKPSITRDWSDGTEILLISVSEALEVGRDDNPGEPVFDGWRS